jgi:hypothetical protein
MAILHASNLLAGMTQNSTPSTTTSSAPMSDTYFEVPSSIWAPASFRGNVLNAYQEVDLNATQTEFWTAFNHFTLASSGHTGHMMTCKVKGGSDAISLYHTSNILNLKYWNGSSWVDISGQVSSRYNLGVAGGNLELSTTSARFDVHIKIHSSAGWIRVYRAGLLILSFEGNTVFNSVTAVDQIRFYHSSIVQTSFAEILISNERTIGLRCYTASVNGAGASTTFTSGTFASVDEESNIPSTVDTDYGESSTADQVLGLALDTLANSIYKIYAVVVNFRSLYIAGAPEKANAFLRVAATNYHGSDKTLLTTYEGQKEIWETNPNTAVAWVSGDIAALEAGIRSRT